MSVATRLLETLGIEAHGPAFEGLQSVGDSQAVRLELICRVRRLIESGQYDSDDRLQRALDRLLDSMM